MFEITKKTPTNRKATARYVLFIESSEYIFTVTSEFIGNVSIIGLMVMVMVFNATFNNISVISWRSVLLVGEAGVPGEYHRPVTDKLYHIMLY